MWGTLWVVATPLGNLGDLSPRARDTLARADVILAEDTRRCGQLLQWAGIAGQRILSLHEHNEDARQPDVLRLLAAGQQVALVSDAGTPLMADPGYHLVAACRKQGVPVVPVPGPCAVVTALMASGLPPYPFVFLGFLPRKSGEINNLFSQYASIQATLVFFERKNRVPQALELAHAALGEREFCLARELTKKHEEFITGRLGQDCPEAERLLGEVTCVLGPPVLAAVTSEADVMALVTELAQGQRPKDVARTVQAQVQGWSLKQIYALVLAAQME
ncbi:16S rRNA (cytidine(1402)-2'-O)-methyltransferase [Desulfovibrionales bacterium]